MIKVNKKPVELNYYPDGTHRIHLEFPVNHPEINIEWLYEPNEEMTLYYIVRHLRSDGEQYTINLDLPYIPNARMDRVKKDSEVFTLKYFCDFINDLKFDNVFVRDPHSNVATALINRVICEDINHKIAQLIANTLDYKKDVVFFPDEGASKRYESSVPLIPASKQQYRRAFGIKRRDWESGKILGLDVCGDIPTEPFNVLIVDDISSYGGTFLHSAKKLKELGAEKIWLYVTHCENSILDGELIKSDLLEKIYTTKSIFTKQSKLIEIIGGKNND